MHIPDNEGRACDGVVRFLEKWTGETRADVRHPEKDGIGPPVDLRLKLGTQEYAIEHTRIETFENQIKTGVVFKEINICIKRRLSGVLPRPAYYELHVPTDVRLPERKEKRNQALSNLVEWIRKNAQSLHERNSERSRSARSPIWWSDDCVKGTPSGLNCEIELLRWPEAALIRRRPGDLRMKLIAPDDYELEALRIERLRRAFSDKCPKLARCKKTEARTVLILENLDTVTRFDLIGKQLPKLLAEHADAPDEVFLVETGFDLWWVYPMKRDDDHWPTVGMPQRGQLIYEPDKLPTAGMSKRYRDALGLDKLYTPHPKGWVPATFEKDELDDLAPSRV